MIVKSINRQLLITRVTESTIREVYEWAMRYGAFRTIGMDPNVTEFYFTPAGGWNTYTATEGDYVVIDPLTRNVFLLKPEEAEDRLGTTPW